MLSTLGAIYSTYWIGSYFDKDLIVSTQWLSFILIMVILLRSVKLKDSQPIAIQSDYVIIPIRKRRLYYSSIEIIQFNPRKMILDIVTEKGAHYKLGADQQYDFLKLVQTARNANPAIYVEDSLPLDENNFKELFEEYQIAKYKKGYHLLNLSAQFFILGGIFNILYLTLFQTLQGTSSFAIVGIIVSIIGMIYGCILNSMLRVRIMPEKMTIPELSINEIPYSNVYKMTLRLIEEERQIYELIVEFKNQQTITLDMYYCKYYWKLIDTARKANNDIMFENIPETKKKLFKLLYY